MPASAERDVDVSAAEPATERLSVRRRPSFRLAAIAVGLVLLALLPNLINTYWQFVAAQTLVMSIAVLSVVVLFRASAALALSQAAFMGFGACAFSAAELNWGLPMPLAALSGVVIAGLAGGLMALPALRLRGLDLAVLTLAVSVAGEALVFHTGAPLQPQAFGAVVDPVSIFGNSLSDETTAYYVALTFAAVVFGAVMLMLSGPVGHAWSAMRISRASAASVGLRTVRHKAAAFVLSAALAGLAGVLLLAMQTSADEASFSVSQSMIIAVAAVLGGLEWPLGALVGGAGIVLVPQILAEFGVSGDWFTMVLGFAVVVVVIKSRERLIEMADDV